MFESEAALTHFFDTALLKDQTPFTSKYSALEFDYKEGRADVIASDDSGNLFAFEMKLKKWKQALYQAYRNSSFAHYSYVVVPSNVAKNAAKYEHEFVRRGVGLCSIDEYQISIEIDAKWANPLRPWLTASAREYIIGGPNAQCTTF